jgi:H+/Cl- antiporter ClcA
MHWKLENSSLVKTPQKYKNSFENTSEMSLHKKRSRMQNYIITDYFTNYEDITKMPTPGESKGHHEFDGRKRNVWMRIFKSLNLIHPNHWVFLILVGIITAIVAFIIDQGVQWILTLKMRIWEEHGLHWGFSFIIWIWITLFFTSIAASIGQFISKDAEGSGIPELKSILAGVNIYRYLSFRTLLGKILGIFSALSAGLSVGKEGPFVHVSAGIVNKLSKFKPFKDIYYNQSLKKQMLAASVAAGVTATFGAPIGGVLFSIEVTSTYYMVSNLWKAFFCSCWAIFTFKVLSVVGHVELFTPVKLVTLQLDYQYFAYAALGIISGFFGALFINVVSQLIFLRTKLKLPYLSNRWIFWLSIGLIAALTSFPIDFLRLPERTILQEMFSQDPLQTKDKAHWNQPNIIFNLAIFAAIKFSLTALSLSCPIPAGVFTPTFVLGAVFGRLYGYLLKQIFGDIINETAYSIIGAASVTSSVTRTISVAMIVFEINGELSYMIPVLLGVLLSYAISNSLWVSIFDVLLDMKDLPYLPAIRMNENYALKASNMMNRKFEYLWKNSKLSDIALLLFQMRHTSLSKSKSIPVIKSEQSQVLIFSVELQSLRKYLFQYYNSIAHSFIGEDKEKLNSYFYQLNAISQTDMVGHNSQGFKEMLLKSSSLQFPKKRTSFDSNKNSETLSIREFDNPQFKRRSSHDLEEDIEIHLSESDAFWATKIDWENECVEVDKAPFTLMEETPLAKIHFLFTMLNVSQIFVISEGHLVGIITKQEFLKRRSYEEDHDDSGSFVPPNLGLHQDIHKSEMKSNAEDHKLYFEGRRAKLSM